ncbi:hypothetical protein UB31_04750 [Bradyrhizobium sp. LTSP849]|nr:hypothetical protein UP06_38120 [Bradyrhizobium sp. LTSP857]KJC54227.1 hypothetical protein UB31_04750 [Bradyrhizobium sp. LTSP849]
MFLVAIVSCGLIASEVDAKPKQQKRPVAVTTPKPPAPAQPKTAQQLFTDPIVILDSDAGNSSGVSIKTAPWSLADNDKTPKHVDATYYAFAQAHKEPLNRYDFYYRLEIVPQFRQGFRNCTKDADIAGFFQKLFKTETGALVTVKANIQHRWSSSSATDLFKGDAALVLAAKGGGIDGKPGAGCFFDFTTRPSFPWITWNGGRADRIQDMFDDFQIKFTVAGGKTKDIGAVNAVVTLFSSFSAAARWFSVADPLASPVSTGTQAFANSLQDAFKGAGTVQNQVTVSHFLNAYFPDRDAQHGKILVEIPDLFQDENGGSRQSPGNLAIYVRRQASIALQGSGNITPDTIFDTPELAYRQCAIGKIASGTCEADNVSIRSAMTTALKSVDGNLDPKNPAAALFDLRSPETKPKAMKATKPGNGEKDKQPDGATDDPPADRRKLVYDMCKGMREVSLLQLHLSTLDEIAVRWAFTKEGGVQDALAEVKKDKQKEATFLADFGRPWQEIEAQCWNEGDQLLLADTAKALGRPLDGSIENKQEVARKGLDLMTLAEKDKVLTQQPIAPAAPETAYVFDAAQRAKFANGTFGFDLSHYEIDVDGSPPECRTDRQLYNSSSKCSCTVDWQKLAQQGLRYVYYEHTVGGKPADFSAGKVWAELESLHRSRKLFRGAYHFLMPNPPGVPAGDATVQAEYFLQSVGAIDGHKPEQLSPVLDMEGTHTAVKVDSDEFKQCPEGYLRKSDDNPPKYTCDMWYKVKREDIAALARDWISRVEKATGKKVIIYTNTDDWWDLVMTPTKAGEDLIKNHPIWIARYTKTGPEHNSSWGGSGVKWGMPPLPADATYPDKAYDIAHFWQFTESGKLRFEDGSTGNGITCNRNTSSKTIDFSYVPVAGDAFEKLFGVAEQPREVSANIAASPGKR